MDGALFVVKTPVTLFGVSCPFRLGDAAPIKLAYSKYFSNYFRKYVQFFSFIVQ
jgi:hypothetical protein